MVEFIELLFLTSLWIWGFHGFMQLTGLSKKLNCYLPENVCKPLFDCPPCCSSIHGTISFILFYHDINLFLLWPTFIFCLCGLNYIIKEHLYES